MQQTQKLQKRRVWGETTTQIRTETAGSADSFCLLKLRHVATLPPMWLHLLRLRISDFQLLLLRFA